MAEPCRSNNQQIKTMCHKLVLNYCVYNADARKVYNTKLHKTSVNFSVGYEKQKYFRTHNNLRQLRTLSEVPGNLDSPSPDCSRFRVVRADALKRLCCVLNGRDGLYFFTI